MKPWRGVNPGAFSRRTADGKPSFEHVSQALVEGMSTIDSYLTDVDAAFRRITNGQAPSAAGSTISITSHHLLSDLTTFDDHTQYLYLPGRSAGQTITVPRTGVTDNTVEINGNSTLMILRDPNSYSFGGGIHKLLDINYKSSGGSSDIFTITLDGITPRQIFSFGANNTGGYLTFRDSNANVLFALLGGSSPFPLYYFRNQASSPQSAVGIRASVGSTGDHIQYQDSSANVLSGVKITGEYYLTAGAASGKVLVSDANGVGTWQSVGGLTADFVDNLFTVHDDGDSTKKVALQLSGISTATTRTLTIPNASGTLTLNDSASTFTSIKTFDADNGGTLTLSGLDDGATSLLVYNGTNSGFTGTFVCTPLSANRSWSFPDGNGSLVLTGATQTLQAKTLSTTCLFNMGNGAASGAKLTQASSTTKYIQLDLSPLTTNRTKKWQDDTETIPGVVAPTSATTDKTGQTASIGTTTAYTTTHAGFYRMSAYAVFTAVTTPGALTFTALWTDPQQAQTNAFVNAVAYTVAGNYVQGSCVFYATSGTTIQYSTTLTGTGTYNSYVRVSSLS